MSKKASKKYVYVGLGSIQVRVNKKSLYKSATWRVISICMSFSMSYYFLGDSWEAGKFTAAYALMGTGLYYAHERAWAVIRKKRLLNI